MEGGQPLEMPNRMLRGLRGSDRSYQSSAIGGLEQEREGVWYSLTVLTKGREREKGKEVWCCWELVKMLLESCASTVSITGVQVVRCGQGQILKSYFWLARPTSRPTNCVQRTRGATVQRIR